MPVLGWMLLAAAVGGGALLQFIIHKHIQGPAHCMGCGKCGETGVCVLTGKPVGPRRKE